MAIIHATTNANRSRACIGPTKIISQNMREIILLTKNYYKQVQINV